jgi:hypothetical protein
MEAMTAASVAALTVYDMVKGVERGVEISGVRLVSKTGGKSGDWRMDADPDDRPAGRRPGDRSAGRITKSRPPGKSKGATTRSSDRRRGGG